MKRSELQELILEAYAEVLSEQDLPTTADELFSKFPTLYRTIENLLTTDYKNFLSNIEWVSPKPSTFRVVLQNQQAFYLKWTGKGFEAQIEGKRYNISNVSEFQQALDRLGELLKHSEPTTDGTDLGGDTAAADADFGAPAPGAEPTTGEPAVDFGDEAPAAGGEEAPEFEEPAA
jgi:hypothetical protein